MVPPSPAQVGMQMRHPPGAQTDFTGVARMPPITHGSHTTRQSFKSKGIAWPALVQVCMQGGIHPDFTGDTYLAILAAAKAGAPGIHVHAFSPLEVHQVRGFCGGSVNVYFFELLPAFCCGTPQPLDYSLPGGRANLAAIHSTHPMQPCTSLECSHQSTACLPQAV